MFFSPQNDLLNIFSQAGPAFFQQLYLNDILNDDIKFVVYDRQIILTPSDVTALSATMQQQLKITTQFQLVIS